MNAGDANHDLSEDQLDALLAAADGELLQHIHAGVDPIATLLAVMTGTAAEDLVPPPEQPEHGASKHPDHPAELIAWRFSAHRLTCHIDEASDCADLLEIALKLLKVDEACEVVLLLRGAIQRARDLAHDLDQGLDSDRYLNPGLFDDLTRALDLVHDLLDNADLGLARNFIRALRHDLDSASSRVRTLSLAGDEIDASGADLSNLEIDDLDLVAGVVWTAGTVWPPGLRSRILTRSREIRPGVFQVSNGTERTSVFTSQ